MAVYLINPNSTESMTESALCTARAAALELDFIGWTSHDGPRVIEGPEDGQASIPPLLVLVRQASDAGAEAIIIACFDDTGLSEARAIAQCPVIGIGQASFHLAALLSDRRAVITTVPAAVSVIEGNLAALGFKKQISVVEAAHVGVSELSAGTAKALEKFSDVAANINKRENIKKFILGCSGAITITENFTARTGFTTIDGVTAAARLSLAILRRP